MSKGDLLDEANFDAVTEIESLDELTPEKLSGLIDEASAAHHQRLLKDPEWNTARWESPSGLIGAFAQAIFMSDEWMPDYKVPLHLEKVLNRLSEEVEKLVAKSDLKASHLFKISLMDAENLYWTVCAMPEVIGWNEMKTPFIDLHALVRNAAVLIRNKWRLEDQFDAEFEKEHGKLS